MKKQLLKSKLLLILFVTLFTNAALSQNVVVKGKVENPKMETIVLKVKSPIKEEQKTVKYDENGEFTFEFTQHYPHDNIILMDDNWYRIFTGPNDTLTIEVKNNELSFSGKYSQINHEIQKMPSIALAYPFNKSPQTMIDHTSLDPIKHKNDALAAQENYFKQLKEFNNEYNTSSLFREWAYYYGKFYTIENLLNTTGLAARHFNNEKYKNLPTDYYDFLDDPDVLSLNAIHIYKNSEAHLTKNPFISSCTNEFITGYEMFLINNYKPSDLSNITKEEGTKLYFDIITQNTMKDLREIYLTKAFNSMLETNEIDVVRLFWPDYNHYIKNEVFREFLMLKLKEVEKLANSETIPEGAILTNLAEEELLNGLISELIEKNEGKILYIDVWGTWCGACIKEMPKSIELQELYEDKEVEFVYLCAPAKEITWTSMIKKLNLGGQHYLLSQDQYNLFASEFQFEEIPRYILVDQNGVVISKNAPRPSEVKIMQMIDGLLSKNKI